MTNIVQDRAQTRIRARRKQASPLTGPLLLFAATALTAAAYIGYVLWPRWPEVPVGLNAPALPITIAGVTFNIEPAAIRWAVQRHPGRQERVDLDYLWPSLQPPGAADTPGRGALVNLNERLFVTIAAGGQTLPLMQRVEQIYPRYLVAQPTAGPDGLTLRGFRDGTPYQGEELVFASQAPAQFLARCSLHGVVNSGSCLLERRIGNADITVRFARAWLDNWREVAAGIDKLIARLHAN